MDVKNFDTEVLAASQTQPIVVDFWAPWCGPCRILGPVLEKLEREAAGRWRLAKVNTDEEPELSQTWQVRGIPAVKMFYKGEVAAEFVGALPEIQVRHWLDTNLPSAAKDALQAAKATLARGATQESLALLRQVLEHEPQNLEARILLAEQLFATAPEAAIEMIEMITEGQQYYDRAAALRTLQRLRGLQPTASLTASPAWRNYAEGNEALRAGNYAGAFEGWIAALQRDRKLDDDGARRACVALFNWLGNEHPLVQEYRRKFSLALY